MAQARPEVTTHRLLQAHTTPRAVQSVPQTGKVRQTVLPQALQQPKVCFLDMKSNTIHRITAMPQRGTDLIQMNTTSSKRSSPAFIYLARSAREHIRPGRLCKTSTHAYTRTPAHSHIHQRPHWCVRRAHVSLPNVRATRVPVLCATRWWSIRPLFSLTQRVLPFQ